MLGAVERLIRSQGAEYTVLNAAGSGGRSTPDYTEDGTLLGIRERRSLAPQTVKDSAGAEIESDLEIRALPDDTLTLRGVGDGNPTKLEGATATYRVLDVSVEDSGVTALTVEVE